MSRGSPKVSVILPVHNAEKYLRQCLDSVVSQTLQDVEIICVDDCSTDGSMAPVEAWAAEDGRVRIVRNEENLGPGPSRNRGIEAACGDYLSFVDPDDYVSPDFYQLLYVAAISDGGHDIAKGVHETVDLDGTRNRASSRALNKRIRTAMQKGAPLFGAFTYSHQAAIYRRSLIAGGVRYGTSCNAQDTTFLLAATLRTEDVVLEERALYYYVKREESAVETKTLRRYLGELDALAEKAEILEDMAGEQLVQDYLHKQAGIHLARYYQDVSTCSSLAETVNAYSEKMAGIIEARKALRFLPSRSPAIKLLVEKRVLLPDVACLASEDKLEGAMKWLDFIGGESCAERNYTGEAAREVADSIQDVVNRRGLRTAKGVCLSLAKRSDALPASQRARLWAKTCRLLATKRNMTAIAKKVLRKVGR